MTQTDTLIIGASISGLASTAALQKQRIGYIILEKQSQTATTWRNHYERLHLHTSKRFSNLPYKKFGRAIPRYPSKQQVIDYLGEYQQAFGIQPVFNSEALSVRREADCWITETAQDAFRSKYLIMATGAYGKPKPIAFKGMETFPGRILHSSAYRTGKDFSGQKVLVVGFGNSACEIAVDLYEQGAHPVMAVRSPVNVIPRDIFGLPVLELSLLLNRLPPRMADMLSAPLIRGLTGDIGKIGLAKMPWGPLEQIRRNGKAPVLDIGTLSHIRAGHIKVRTGLDCVAGSFVHFKDGEKESFDSLVAAIGYQRDFGGITGMDSSRFEDLRVCADRQEYFGRDGLYFCGYWISPTGQIREIGRDARKIARSIAARERLS